MRQYIIIVAVLGYSTKITFTLVIPVHSSHRGMAKVFVKHMDEHTFTLREKELLVEFHHSVINAMKELKAPTKAQIVGVPLGVAVQIFKHMYPHEVDKQFIEFVMFCAYTHIVDLVDEPQLN